MPSAITPDSRPAPLHTAYLYGGTSGTVPTWHVKGYRLYGAKHLIDGVGRVWHIVPSNHINDFFKKQEGR